MTRKIKFTNLLLFFVIISTHITAQKDSISLKDLFQKNKIQSITVLDSSKIQFFFKDTIINGFDYLQTEYSIEKIDLIEKRQIELFNSVKVRPYYMNSSNIDYIVRSAMPIFFLILLWTPGILAIIYFIRSTMKVKLKIFIIGLLIIIPISGIIIYPLRNKIHTE